MTTRLRPCTDPARWDAARAASGRTPIPFHDLTWLRSAAAMTATTLHPMVVERSGEPIGILPLLCRRIGPLGLVSWSPTPYAGPVLAAADLAEGLELATRWSFRHGVGVQRYGFSPLDRPSEEVLRACGYTVSHERTYLLDLGVGVDALWAGTSAQCRKKVRRARARGIEVHPVRDTGSLGRAVRAAFASRGRRDGLRGVFPPRYDDLTAGPAAVHLAEARDVDGRVHAVLATLCLDGYAVTWAGGVLPEHRDSPAGVLLYWDAIAWACGRGAHTLDLLGVPDEGIDRFKRQFGGTSHPVTVAERALPGLRMLRSG